MTTTTGLVWGARGGLAAVAAMALACGSSKDAAAPAGSKTVEADQAPAVATGPIRGAAIAHGGVGSPPERADGCRAAVDAALAVLDRSGDPVAAAIAGVKLLENDERYNAGTGSRVRIDGTTVQMDAALMHSDGRFGAVAGIEQVKNPIDVARAVLDTPHLLVAGDGATRLARRLGHAVYEPATEAMKAKTAVILDKLRAADPTLPEAWQNFDYRGHWNFERTLAEAGLSVEQVGHDTVGVAVRAPDGTFAVALSTGGTAITLRGRVGDVPILGAGLFAGPEGAVAATGAGERIVEAGLSRWVYDAVAAGAPVQTAADDGVNRLDGKGSIGLIVIGERKMTAAADRPMAWAGRELGSDTWSGPDPTAK